MTSLCLLALALATVLACRPAPARVTPRRPSAPPVLLLVVTGAIALRGDVRLVVWCVLGGATVLAALSLRRRAARRSAAQEVAAAVGESCEVVAAELAAGRPAAAALRAAAQVWDGLGPVAEIGELGGDVARSLRTVAATTPGAQALTMLAGAWTVSLRTGAGLADASAQVAESVSRRQATARLVSGELASARATAKLMAVLPLLALLMGSGAGGDPWHFLVGTPAGWVCAGAGLTLTFAGLTWIEVIAEGVQP